jgi:hypothetical protein
MVKNLFKAAGIVAAIATSSLPAMADEIADTISQAEAKYKAGELAGAGTSLQYALNLLNEKRAEKLMALIPKEAGEWKGDEGRTESMGMLGGGFTLSRNFTKGDKEATVSIIMESPLIQQMLGIISNPIFAGQMGMKMRDIKGEKGSYNSANGELMLVINNTILVKVEASGSPEADILVLARAVDVAGIKGLK